MPDATPADRSATMSPFIRYEDAPAAVRWLVRAFGLEERAVHAGPDNTIAHAELGFGGSVLMLGPARTDELRMGSPRALGGVTQGIYIHVEAIDTHYGRAREAGAEIVYPLRDTEYGSREYGARDLEGHLWSFGTYRPGTAP
jgi:uncharacterized glyoxalase superfamily protein PhnB